MPHHHSSGGDCLFCRIAQGAVPAHIVAETETLVAFLDIHPIRPGHAQIIPRAHYPYFDDLPPHLAAGIVGLGQRLATALKRIHGVKRVGFLFTGGDVAHVHAHVTPLHAHDDITSRRYIAEETVTYRNAPRAGETELAQMAAALRKRIGEGGA